jgi:putative two-component system response regulator
MNAASTIHSLNLAFKYTETISLGELLLTDCSKKTERIMLAVLIVDDDHAFRTALRTLFEEGSGFDNCVEAANASEALDKTKQLSPNLAVVDFSMPEANGLQLARELKAREPALPIFMLTADYDVNIEKEALALGITAVFSKLDDLTTLIANARAVCGLE